jgi:hypothetical protein
MIKRGSNDRPTATADGPGVRLSGNTKRLAIGSKIGAHLDVLFHPKTGVSCARSTKVLTAHDPTVASWLIL